MPVWWQGRKVLRPHSRHISNDNISGKMFFWVRIFMIASIIGFLLLHFQQEHDLGQLSLDFDSKLSLAVLVAGSTQRFLFDPFVKHVVHSRSSRKPVHIDYYAILMLQAGPAFRQDLGYMGHLAGRDDLFDGVLATSETQSLESIRKQMLSIMKNAINTSSSSTTTKNTATIQALRLIEAPIQDDPVLDAVKKREQKRQKNDSTPFNLFKQFPMMDLREKALTRTQNGNKNMIRLFLALESLWKAEFLDHEKQQHYDYVLILRDDTLWIDDFDLHKVIATNPTADAYVLSCDAREPKMLPPEINDHAILIRREKAGLVGKYVSAMANADLQKCHESVTEWLGTNRGCNSEMILKHLLETNGVKVQLVPQSVLPFQRSVLIDGKSTGSGKNFYCFHKFCQSVEDPLEHPPEMQSCKTLTFD